MQCNRSRVALQHRHRRLCAPQTGRKIGTTQGTPARKSGSQSFRSAPWHCHQGTTAGPPDGTCRRLARRAVRARPITGPRQPPGCPDRAPHGPGDLLSCRACAGPQSPVHPLARAAMPTAASPSPAPPKAAKAGLFGRFSGLPRGAHVRNIWPRRHGLVFVSPLRQNQQKALDEAVPGHRDNSPQITADGHCQNPRQIPPKARSLKSSAWGPIAQEIPLPEPLRQPAGRGELSRCMA